MKLEMRLELGYLIFELVLMGDSFAFGRQAFFQVEQQELMALEFREVESLRFRQVKFVAILHDRLSLKEIRKLSERHIIEKFSR